MSIQDQNIGYANQLKNLMLDLPSVGIKAAAKIGLQEAAMKTQQDSGQAAFNWHLAWDGALNIPFLPSMGVTPVGSAREHRGAGHRQVVNAVIVEEIARTPVGRVSFVRLYNPLEQKQYELNADLEMAGTHATDPAPMNSAAERASNAYLRSRNKIN